MTESFDYDVALSFAGEDRTFVDQVANYLEESGVKVFYDLFEEEDLWGKNLYEHLSDVYYRKAQYTVMFISKFYAKKLWTNHERQAMQARAFEESKEYILPARFDDTEIPSLLPTIGYISLDNKTPVEFSEIIKKKLLKSVPHIKNKLAQELRETDVNSILEGLKSPADWFINWNEDINEPTQPPRHWLLNSVFVERDLYSEILHDFLSGKKSAGITGFVGMGGVGKTYTALKISWELIEKHNWHVVWVGLLQQGTDEALVQIAKCFGLFFSNNIKREERVSAIRRLMNKANCKFPKLLVVLDNAENFPRLDLLLEALASVPILITSRKRECSDVIPYHKVDPLQGDSAIQFCGSLMSHYNIVLDESKNDFKNLQLLCDELGGHPLGIRLALSGFVRKPLLEQLKHNRFSLLLSEIKGNNVVALTSETSLSDTLDEKKLHKSIESTFLWTYEDLIKLGSSLSEKTAYVLLPIMSALGTTNVTREICDQGIQFLLKEWSDERIERNKKIQEGHLEKEMRKELDLSGGEDKNEYVNKENKSDKKIIHKWLDSLIWLMEDNTAFDSAVSLLVDLALVEILDADTQTFALHPLIREFSFQQTDFVVLESESEHDLVEVFSPSSEDIFRMAIDVVSSEHGNEALLDLLPRLKQSRYLAEMAISKIKGQYDYIYHHPSYTTWPYLSVLLGEALLLAKHVGLIDQEVWIKLKLGELNNRMGKPDGRILIDSGINKYLKNKDKSDIKNLDKALIYDWIKKNDGSDILWGSAYNQYYKIENKTKENVVYHVLQIIRLLSSNHSNNATVIKRILNDAGEYIYANDILNESSLSLSCVGEKYVSNIILDLSYWLKMALSLGLNESAIKKASDIFMVACNNHLDTNNKSTSISSGHLLYFKKIRTINSFEYGLTGFDKFDTDISIIRQELSDAGIRGYSLEVSYCEAMAKKYFENREWEKVSLFIEQSLNSLTKLDEFEEENIRKRYELQLLDICVAFLLNKQSKYDLNRCEQNLKDLESFKSLPLVYLAKACFSEASNEVSERDLYISKVEAAFREYLGYIPPYARPLLNAWRNWSSSNDDIILDNWIPWSIDYSTLPERVLSKKDNRTMRLVKDGIQWTKEGKETWLWSFYIDEQPLSYSDIVLYCNANDITPQHELNTDAVISLNDGHFITEYMKSLGKKIPIKSEVYAAWLQHKKEIMPEEWQTTEEMLDGIFHRIKNVIEKGKPLSIDNSTLKKIKPKSNKTKNIEKNSISNRGDEFYPEIKTKSDLIEYFSGDWIRSSKEMKKFSDEHVDNGSRPSSEHTDNEWYEFFVMVFMSMSLGLKEKKRIVNEAMILSDDQFSKLKSVFENEKKEFFKLINKPNEVNEMNRLINIARDVFYSITGGLLIKENINWHLWNVVTVDVAHTDHWLEEISENLSYSKFNLTNDDSTTPVIRGIIPIFTSSDLNNLIPINA